MFDFETMRRAANGTMLLVGISYHRQPEDASDANRGMTEPKILTYGMFKARGLWYVTGTGQTPQAAGVTAVKKWLAKNGRYVEWVRISVSTAAVWPPEEPRSEVV
jgi:hypothetical protein